VETPASFEARAAPPPYPANRKQGQAKPDCGGCSESPTQQPPGDYRYCACSRLYSRLHSLTLSLW
jgi:hypothetical protein